MHIIKGFPSQRQNARVTNASPRVRFSPMSQAIIYCEVQNKTDLFYSKKDYQHMNNSRKLSVMAAHKKLHSLSSSCSSNDPNSSLMNPDDYYLTGLENLINHDLTKRLISSKKRCWRVVLEEQERQVRTGVHDPIKLAAASRRHTLWAAERAHNIGLVHEYTV